MGMETASLCVKKFFLDADLQGLNRNARLYWRRRKTGDKQHQISGGDKLYLITLRNFSNMI